GEVAAASPTTWKEVSVVARCGCAGTCSCKLEGGQGTSTSGRGSSANPYTVDVRLSTDAENTLEFGSDGGLYAPATRAFRYASGQLRDIDGSTTAIPSEWDTVPADAWPPITVTAPVTGFLQITVGARVGNGNTATATVYAGWEMSIGGTVTAPGNWRAVGSLFGSGVDASRTRVYDVTKGQEVIVTPAYRASSYSTEPGGTFITSGSLDVLFFAA
ncbi:hypothetical protein ACIRO1_47365, partial [Streptomyces sp. NPDC102381]|uniref:hypothetical protein n=1 Tax=Streptomyces sp. NPDC102381 TaxID=3366164 RepID=UPI003809B426